jgi:hypothetical protein
MSFARKHTPRARVYPSAIPEHLRRAAVMTASAANEAIPKENAIQHAGYMGLVRLMNCAHCGKAGPSQFCHSDEGKGQSIKSDCRNGWPGCPECHHAVGTARIYPKQERRDREARMAALTREAIETAGLWPANLPKWTKEKNG